MRLAFAFWDSMVFTGIVVGTPKMRRMVLLVIAALVLGGSAEGAVRLPAIFSDGMVLQHGDPCPVWGWARPGENVTVKMLEQERTAAAGADGAWRVVLPPLPATRVPTRLRVETPQETVVVNNVLVGETWLCIGEGNVFFPVRDRSHPAADPDRLLARPPAELRLFTVQGRPSLAADASVQGTWQPLSAEPGAGGSALASFFALHLARLQGGPVGVVVVAAETAGLESWVAPEALLAVPSPDWNAKAKAVLQEMKELPEQQSRHLRQWRNWWEFVKAKDSGFAEGWSTPGFGDLGWREARLPKQLIDGSSPAPGRPRPEFRSWTGALWFRRSMVIPVDWVGRDLAMSFAGLSPRDKVWVNGVELAGQDSGNRMGFTVPGSAVRSEAISIAVRLFAYTPERWGFCSLEDWEVSCPSRGGAPQYLAGTWKWNEGVAAERCPPPPPTPMQLSPPASRPCCLFNGQIKPLSPYLFRGIVLCQGEGNIDDPSNYKELMAAAVAGWRQAWNSQIPILYVQLPPSDYPQAVNKAPLLREAQVQFLAETPGRVDMVTTMDLGTPNSPVMQRRDEAGRRLAALAAVRIYGKALGVKGPTLKDVAKEGNVFRISFKNAAGLKTVDGADPLGFVVSGTDGKFLAAQAKIDGESVVVGHPDIADPAAVRYGFTNNPRTNLVNADGVPAQPFRTDTWKNYEVSMPTEP